MAEKQNRETRLEVDMLGRFEVRLSGQPISLGSNPTANALKMIEIIFLYSNQGVSKEELLRDVFNGKELSDQNNSFNNLLYQARHLLQDSGIPGEHFIVNRRGEIRLEDGIHVETDVEQFRTECHLAGAEDITDEEREEHYRKAFELYQGELLPDFRTENWVLREGEFLVQDYMKCLNWLAKYYKSAGKYDAMIRLYDRGNEVCPDSTWQAGRIRALALAGDYEGAAEYFRKTAKFYLDDLEIPIPKTILGAADAIESRDSVPGRLAGENDLLLRRSEKLANLPRKLDSQAYCCPERSLGDVWQILRRNCERRGRSLFMVTIQIVTKTVPAGVIESQIEEAMRRTLVGVLNTEDVFTCFGHCCYAVIPINTRREESLRLLRRIQERFHDNIGYDIRIHGNVIKYEEIDDFLSMARDW